MWPETERRDPERADRRLVPRGGRRETDLPHPVVCRACGTAEHVRGLGRTSTGAWCHCQRCGSVWRLVPSV